MPKPQLGPHEHEIKSFLANRSQGSRAVGGRLVLTNHRLAFFPHKLDDVTGGASWECSLDSIESVDITDRGRNPFDGSVRRRVQVDPGGPLQYFVVFRVGKVVAHIKRAVAGG